MTTTKYSVRALVLTALFIALGLILPQIIHFIPNAGSILLPMHIPVLLCGLVVGAPYGAVCGAVTVSLSILLNGMPPLFPIGVCMIAELAVYGFTAGICQRSFRKTYPALILAMLAGRAVNGVAMTLAMGMAGKPYGMSAFLSGAFITAFPGIVLQLLLIPPIVAALARAKMAPNVR